MPQKADSASEVDSDSGSEDQGRGGAVKRKPAPAKVIVVSIHCQWKSLLKLNNLFSDLAYKSLAF